MNVQYLGHSCFFIQNDSFAILIDPFLEGNPLAAAKPEDLNPTHICVTHAHGDHIGDAANIARNSGATVYTTPEVAELLEGAQVVAGNIGGRVQTEFGWLKYLAATHSSGVPGGTATGFLLNIGANIIYHAGDTGLMMDMQLLQKENIDLALLPIGGFYTMGIEDAVTAVEYIRPKLAIPMHYNTFPVITADPAVFKDRVEKETGAGVHVLAPGETFALT